ncbi:MAG: hypothetical protein R3B41_02100 [Candidatus Doudnabacteria bacterium]
MKYFNTLAKISTAVVIAIIVVMGGLGLAQAAELKWPDNDDASLSLSTGQTYKNLYAGGANVAINSDVAGDLWVMGGTVHIDGNIEKDLVVMGGSVYVNGSIGDDLRILGGDILVSGSIGGDIVGAGGNIRVNDKATIAGDVLIAGGNVFLDAPIAGRLDARVEQLTLNAAVNGLTEIKAQKVSFGSNAIVSTEGSYYKAHQEAQISDGAQVQAIQYQVYQRGEDGHRKRGMAAIFTLGFVVKIVAMILAALLMIKLFPRTAQTLVNNMANKPWLGLLVGFLAMIVVPVGAVILCLIMFGFYIAIIAVLLWILYMVVSALLASVFVGSWITKFLNKTTQLTVDWQAVVIGVVVLAVMMLIPIVGAIVVALLWLTAVGTVIRFVYHHIRQGEGGEVMVVEDQV